MALVAPGARAALVFLILYSIDFAVVVYMYATRRMLFKSRYTVILFHIIIRLAAQSTGLAFGIVGYKNIGLLVAFFVLGAEGYFTLVLSAYRFLISWQCHNTEAADSWLEPRLPKGLSFWERLRRSFTIRGPDRRPMAFLHHLLIIANTLIIVGGTMLAGTTPSEYYQKFTISRGLGTAGQAFFLSMTVFLLYCVADTIHKSLAECARTGKRFPHALWGIHPTLLVLLAAWPLLTVRGIYGVMASCYIPFSFFDPNNFTATGLAARYIVTSYVLSTTMEWASCTLLIATWFTSRGDPKKRELPKDAEMKTVGDSREASA